MSKLDGFIPTTRSDNIHMALEGDDTDEIIIGGTCRHVFKLPFDYKNVVTSGDIIYKQKLEEVLRIPIRKDMISPYDGREISVTLTPDLTMLFSNTLLDAFCQLRLFMQDGSVLYDDPHKLRVIMPFGFRGESEDGEDFEKLSMKDYSYLTLFKLSENGFLNLTRHHVAIIPEEELEFEHDFFEFDVVQVTVEMAGKDYKLRMIKNNATNSCGTIVVKDGDDIYEILISLFISEGETRCVVRCANIY